MWSPPAPVSPTARPVRSLRPLAGDGGLRAWAPGSVAGACRLPRDPQHAARSPALPRRRVAGAPPRVWCHGSVGPVTRAAVAPPEQRLGSAIPSTHSCHRPCPDSEADGVVLVGGPGACGGRVPRAGSGRTGAPAPVLRVFRTFFSTFLSFELRLWFPVVKTVRSRLPFKASAARTGSAFPTPCANRPFCSSFQRTSFLAFCMVFTSLISAF